ncbi:LysR family transcriptional regulator [Parasedimentitalea maritima]|uniref:LysR family transcriptional regulator n=1 Tax=Parasedimentitalea maritima TaxID=2578117 RepID=A0ABY2UWP9_9RHOB|nr:LysR family transcriptional regulator [Zongyanglinia marina]TLP61387.1 LysR family transcriptional regulator [Zongyanglinia marina]
MIDGKIITAVKALARYESFREAAQAVGTSPASFSRHITQAEEYAGNLLFERRRNGAQLTAAGQQFLSLLDNLDDASSIFEQGVEQLRATGTPTLNIGCGPLTTRTLINPLIEQLLQEMPELRIRITVSATKEPLESLRRGILDVAICDLTHTPDLSDLDIQVIEKKPVSFWARPQHPIHKDAPVLLADIFSADLIAPKFHKHWQAAIAAVLGGDQKAWGAVEKIPKVECDDYGLLADLACRRDLIFGGMRDAVEQHATLGLLKEIPTKQELNWNICAARRKNVSFPALDSLWDALICQFSE